MAGSSTGGSLISDAKLKQLYATMLRVSPARRNMHSGCAIHGERSIPRHWDKKQLLPDASSISNPRTRLFSTTEVPSPPWSREQSLSELIGQLYAPRSGEPRLAHNIISPSCDADQRLELANQLAQANKQKQDHSVVVAFATAPVIASAHWQQVAQIRRQA